MTAARDMAFVEILLNYWRAGSAPMFCLGHGLALPLPCVVSFRLYFYFIRCLSSYLHVAWITKCHY